jgi:CRP-like cAMP-binding protein
MWLIISGRLRTFTKRKPGSRSRKGRRAKSNYDSGNITFKEVDVGRGQSVGEVAMFAASRQKGDKVPTHAGSCIAIRDTELVRLSHFSFMQLCDLHPRSILEITASLARRLQEDSMLVTSRNYSTICVVPAGGQPNVDMVSGFANNLARALEMEGHDTQLMSSDKLEEYLGVGCGGIKLADFFFREQVSQWLIDQEEIYRFQVMLADPTDTEWTKLCIRHADCILVVANASDSSNMSAVESKLLFINRNESTSNNCDHIDNRSTNTTIYTRQRSRKELVLLHRGDPVSIARPSNTRRWFVQRPSIREHHHVRWRVEDDFRRVARCLAGQAVGLVLGGGGSRGLAHLGVIQEMERENIPIDYIGGKTITIKL